MPACVIIVRIQKGICRTGPLRLRAVASAQSVRESGRHSLMRHKGITLNNNEFAISGVVVRRRSLPNILAVVLLSCSFSVMGAQSSVSPAGTRTGKEVVDAVCASCHATGVNNAPRIGDKSAWEKLAARGLTGLTDSALKGIRQMPPHGGRMSLTDDEIKRAVTHMVNQSGGHWAEPINRGAPPAERSGKEVVQTYCAKCHRNGEGGAPKIGDGNAWRPRLKYGLDAVVRSAINGHGGMAPRGGVPNLTDSELRAAITYMFNPASAETKGR
jgi:cytochrome c5